MRLKQIIIVIIIIAALAAAGVFAYLSLTGSSSPAVTPSAATEQNSILPLGTSLNFEKINKFNPTGTQFQYPAVTPADTGLQLNEIMQQ